MANREIIERLNNEMRYGDKMEIARRTGLHKLSVNRFFNGKEDEMIEDTQSKIMTAALSIIEERQKRAKEIAIKTSSLLG